jgi:hypothetical protein
MQKSMNYGIYSNPVAEAAIEASRQVWLAGLGAAAYTRAWARKDAGRTFRALVKEGSAVESQAVRMINQRVQQSAHNASALFNQARATFMATASTIADNATATLARFRAPVVVKREAAAKPRKSGTRGRRNVRTTKGKRAKA